MSHRLDNDRRRLGGGSNVVRLEAPSDDERQEIRSLDPHLDLSLFASERGFGARPVPPKSRGSRAPSLTALAAAASLIMMAVWWVGPQTFGLGLGRVRIESVPAGVVVRVDGVESGVTPLLLTLPVGAHAIEIGSDGTGRDAFEMRVERGPQTYRLQLQPPAATSSPSASLEMPIP